MEQTFGVCPLVKLVELVYLKEAIELDFEEINRTYGSWIQCKTGETIPVLDPAGHARVAYEILERDPTFEAPVVKSYSTFKVYLPMFDRGWVRVEHEDPQVGISFDSYRRNLAELLPKLRHLRYLTNRVYVDIVRERKDKEYATEDSGMFYMPHEWNRLLAFVR